MIFFPRELCEKLQAMGCKSESKFYWGSWEKPFYGGTNPHDKPAFSQNDFTGCHEQARENAKIVWGHGVPPDWIEFVAQQFRYRMIDAPDAVKYLEETMR